MYGKYYTTNNNGGKWRKPSDWLNLPTPQEDEIVMLYPVRPIDNAFAVKVQGAYTIDWGDGVVENYNSGDQAEHSYDYNALNAPIDNTGCKQVIIKIKPQPNNTITNFKVNPTNDITANSIRAIKLNTPNLVGDRYMFIYQRELEDVMFLSHNLTSLSDIFYDTSVKKLYLNTKNIKSFFEAFRKSNMLDVTVDITNADDIQFMLAETSIRNLTLINRGSIPKKVKGLLLSSDIRNINLIGNKIIVADNTDLNYTFYNDFTQQCILENLSYAKGISHYGMYANNKYIKNIELDVGNSTNLKFFVYKCYSLRKLTLKNIPKTDIDIKYASLPREELIKLFNALPDCSGDSTSPTLTITGCRGVPDLTDDDKAIATDKNWTLVT